MIIPNHWAEHRVQERRVGQQATVRRMGWSNNSLAEAQTMAEQRAQAAMAQIFSGQTLPRREPRTGYNGAHGLPIREQIVEQHGATVITRNAYGARCLNTPNVLFADIDLLQEEPAHRPPAFAAWVALGLFAAIATVAGVNRWVVFAALLAASAWLVVRQARKRQAVLAEQAPPDAAEQAARERVNRFAAAYPDWGLRLYRTPAGFRLAATHRLFVPDEPDVTELFEAVQADPVYVDMCRNQQCFRARVSAKPWRAGIHEHIRPKRGTWPVPPEQQAARNAWVATYEQAANGFAACTLIEQLGNATMHPEVAEVIGLHDLLCSAQSELPLA